MGGNKLSTKESIIAREDKTLKKVNFLTCVFIKNLPPKSQQQVYGANKQLFPPLLKFGGD
jgi:hypothetical protein